MAEDCADLVSVIIPCYNQAHFLSDSIESVLRQTHARYEIIVVDDGSTDHPESIAARYPAVRFIRQQRQGAAAARNTGWRASRGGLLVFLDGDDRLLPRALSTGYDCFQAHPACGFVFGRGYLIGPTGKELLPNVISVIPEAGGYEELLERNPIGFPAVVMFRRAAVESLGGFNGVVRGCPIDNASDYDLYLRIAERFPIHSHRVTVAEWRQHGTNTSRNSLMMLRTSLAVLNGQRGPITRAKRYRDAKRRGLRRLREFYGEQLIQELRVEVRSGQISWPRFTVSLLALLRHYPTGVAENALRKIKRMLSRHRRRAGDE